MKNILLLTLLLLSIIITGCNKCDPSNSEGGSVIKDAIVRVIGGQGGANFITNAAQYNAPIEMSLDGGVTYSPVDFTKYSVFSLPTTATCSAGYNRSVTSSDATQVVTYTVSITECDYCDGSTTINNWVLTSVIPSNYTVVYDVQKN
jgi:hypothetical protein